MGSLGREQDGDPYLSRASQRSHNELVPQTKYSDTQLRPAYFRYLTLMAYHVFLSLKVSVRLLPESHSDSKGRD